MKNKIEKTAELLRGDLVGFLREIIAIPSMNGDEAAVIGRIKEEMLKIGYDEVWTDPLGNLFGRIGGGNRVIVIDGHCDTVDVGNRENWTCDPFEGDYRDGVIYGRGACDQKGGLAAAVYAGKIIKVTGLPDDVSLVVTASVLEEDFEGLCWKYILENKSIQPEAVLLTEPSDLQIKRGQRGRMEMKVHTRGVSCHGSAPDRGENAIYKTARVIEAVEQLNLQLHSESILGKGTITVTDIRSSAPSLCAVPDAAVLHLDRRLTKGETMASAIGEIENLPAVKTAGAEITIPEYEVKSYTGLTYPLKAYYPMWLMDESHPLVQTAIQAYQTQFQKKAQLGVWDFSTNGVATKGLFDIPTIGFGPGKEKYAHTPNEQIHEADLTQALAFYASFTHAFGATRGLF